MSYKQMQTMKVLKTSHVVTFCQNELAGTLQRDLAKVPGNAKLLSIEESEDGGQCTLVFQEEVESE